MYQEEKEINKMVSQTCFTILLPIVHSINLSSKSYILCISLLTKTYTYYIYITLNISILLTQHYRKFVYYYLIHHVIFNFFNKGHWY